MAASSDGGLSRLGAVALIAIAAIRRDAMPREPRPIWIVRPCGQISVRAAYGCRGSRQRAGRAPADASVPGLVDNAYREKYDSHYNPTLVRQ